MVGLAFLGYVGLELDHQWGEALAEQFPSLTKASPGGVSAWLATAGTGVLTLAGITISATLVALTLASGQYGSRLLRNFIRALPNQAAIGVLLGSFVLCLIVMREVRETESDPFVPHIAATLAFLAVLGSLSIFVFFVHHLAKSLQSERVVSGVHARIARKELEGEGIDVREDTPIRIRPDGVVYILPDGTIQKVLLYITQKKIHQKEVPPPGELHKYHIYQCQTLPHSFINRGKNPKKIVAGAFGIRLIWNLPKHQTLQPKSHLQ